MQWIAENIGLILGLSWTHLRQSLIAVVLGLLISVPLGRIAWRRRAVRGPVVLLTGLLYTIPSLALLILMPAAFGYSVISETNLVAALTLYAVAILMRSVVDGLDSVDRDTLLSATATGYGPIRRFWSIELPLAGPVILAGVRVVSVSTIALATVGTLIGVNNLGYLFTNGLDRRLIEEVVAGVGAVVLLALLVDLALVVLGRILLPWQRAGTRFRPSGTGTGTAPASAPASPPAARMGAAH